MNASFSYPTCYQCLHEEHEFLSISSFITICRTAATKDDMQGNNYARQSFEIVIIFQKSKGRHLEFSFFLPFFWVKFLRIWTSKTEVNTLDGAILSFKWKVKFQSKNSSSRRSEKVTCLRIIMKINTLCRKLKLRASFALLIQHSTPPIIAWLKSYLKTRKTHQAN